MLVVDNTNTEFQSTLSVRRATISVKYGVPHERISIHALRKESDFPNPRRLRWPTISIHALRKESDHGYESKRSDRIRNFNPRSP